MSRLPHNIQTVTEKREDRVGLCGVFLPVRIRPTVDKPAFLGISIATIFHADELSGVITHIRHKAKGTKYSRIPYLDDKNRP